MIHKGVFVLAVMAALGLAVAFLSVTWLSSPGAGTRPVAAAMPDEGPGDAFNCQTEQPVENAALDIVAVSLTPKTGGYEVHVRIDRSETGPSISGVFENAVSAAVVVILGNETASQTGILETHSGSSTVGLLDAEGEVIAGTDGNVSIDADSVRINFPGDLKEDASLLVETFHQKEASDAVICDVAFSNDLTAPKPTDTPTPTVTPESATATPTPTATPGPATATPTPTVTPELIKVRVAKVDLDGDSPFGFPLAGWEIIIFAGDHCTDSIVASGLTAELDPGRGYYSVLLPPGDYSVTEVQQPGWESLGESCQAFTLAGQFPDDIFITNRRIRTGDVTGDGSTDSRDAAVVLQYTAGLTIQEEIAEFFRGDVNLDETTDSRDATLILQFEAGFIDSLPVGGS